MSSKKFYTDVEIKADIILENKTAGTVPVLDGSKKLVSSPVTSTELGHLSGVTSSVQTQLTAAQGSATQASADAAAAQLDIDNLVTLSGVAANATTLGTFAGTIIPDGATVKAALQSVETFVQALPDPMEYKGNYNASTNVPALANGIGNNGDVYYVATAGTRDFGAGAIVLSIGDRVVYSGADLIYQKWDATDSVVSVFGRMGAVVSTAGDYSAAQVTNVPAGSIAAVTVQAAITELDGDVTAAKAVADAAQLAITNHIANAAGAHAASAISNAPSGNLVATTVQAALNELQSSIDTLPLGSAGDIVETSFSLANNQSVAANVTGLSFANGVVRSFEALVSVQIDAASDLYETFKLLGIQRGSDFSMSIEGVGDSSLVSFSITPAGQVKYTSANYTTFVSGIIKFRAITTSV